MTTPPDGENYEERKPADQPTGPEPLDPLDALRAQFSDEAPEEGRERKSSVPPTAPLQDPEPDFTIGPEDEARKSGASGDLPDWLAETMGASQPAGAGPEEAGRGDLPDWLAGAQPVPASPEQPASSDRPDWLRAADAPPEQPGDVSDDVPDWLRGVMGPSPPPAGPEKAASQEPTPEPERAGEDLPDWFREVQESGPPADTTAPAPPPEPVSDADTPDWLKDIQEVKAEEEAAPSAPAQPGAAPAEEVPDWLQDMFPTGEPAPPETPPPTPEPAAPPGQEDADWVSALGLDVPETPQPPPIPEAPLPEITPPEPAGASFPTGGEELPDWMQAMETAPTEGPPAAPQEGGEGDLLGLDEIFATQPVKPRTEESKPEEGEIEAGELPDWLRGLQPGAEEPAPMVDIPVEEPSPELREQIEDLRFESILSEEAKAEEERKETVGALRDVTGVIQPELIFEGESLSADERVDRIIVTDEQAARIAMIKELLAKEASTSPEAVEGPALALPLGRWLTAVVLLVAIALPVVLGELILPDPPAPPELVAAYQQIDTLPPASVVLVAFEYEPDTAGELQPLALALLDHLGQREELSLYTISTRPTGPAMAERALSEADLAAGGIQVTNLGYLAGGANGIRELAIGSPPFSASPLAFDYTGNATQLTSTRLADLRPDLIIVLAASSTDVRDWVEQAGRTTETPVLAATSAGAAPLAYPYRQSGQLVAVLSGINDAVAYRALSGFGFTAALLSIWNAQAFGGGAAAVLIVLGGIVYGFKARRERQEQD
ncbi:MAG TPA: hypothetical protein ENI95_14540 [Chloroflexi bacterium]|nr:hypothetical protein [Chloroflexota bacterium]